MRVAREYQVPHSTLTLSWSARDLQLAIAQLLARDDVGPCGQPHSLTTLPGAGDRFTVDTSLVCGACAVLEDHDRSHQRDPLKPGTQVRLIDVTAPTPGDDEPDAFGPQFD